MARYNPTSHQACSMQLAVCFCPSPLAPPPPHRRRRGRISHRSPQPLTCSVTDRPS
ncbi:hypothetical protein CC85DRAFT_98749 [Cutaneotrichosporon oleaginosum]|uniref:Uncharacterized protein n=1 Tax=Cutaneotrichosporon oleaginosum TaxID=879819 RepID=A0A0J0XLU3_9TREE|nr:uncharacterized protein CC85DRAFT_98749 [Cutaneotrichosporon oleaginosum]KLT42070.1 hypothetical protein CC85DRAFT_98749 [Cutaneotrichosporon oleaginosum]TXT04691.1 hypothetical protein COLE_07510 [Cutaneotrichosporon oleaginosum]